MIYTPKLNYLFQNVRKSLAQVNALLESHANDTDIILIQEAPFRMIRKFASLDDEEGEEIHGTVQHPRWITVEQYTYYKNKTQVAVYVNRRLSNCFHISMDPFFFDDANILFVTLTNIINGRNFGIINVYNNNSNNKDTTLIKLLRNLSKAEDIHILQGDFNIHCSEWDEEAERDDPLGNDLMNETMWSNLSLVNTDMEATWHHAKNRSSVIDLLFVHDDILSSNGWNYENRSLSRGLSDHSLLYLSTKGYKGDEDAEDKGRSYMPSGGDEEVAFLNDIWTAMCWPTTYCDANDIQKAADDLYACMDGAWKNNCKRTKEGSKPNMWWNDECQRSKLALLKDRKTANVKAYQKSIRDAKKLYFNNKIVELCHTKKPWEAVKWTKARKPAPYSSIKDKNGRLVSSLQDLWPALHTQFNGSHDRDVDWDFINSLPDIPPRTFLPFSSFELGDTLKTTSNTSAPGPDNVGWRHLKKLALNEDFLDNVKSFFNGIMAIGHWPSQFKESITVVIPKPKKSDYSIIKSYRPIALLNTFGKWFTKALAHRMNQDSIRFNLLHPGQFGGIKEHSTIDAGLTLIDKVHKARDAGLHTSCLAVDVAQFFPSVNHAVLVAILTKLGFGSLVANFFASFFDNRHTRYKWGSAFSSSLEASVGVPQGDCLSPILSALYLAIILNAIFPYIPDSPFNLLFYVDDGVLFVSSKSLEYNCGFLRIQYNILVKNLAKLGLKIEPEKTEAHHFIAYDTRNLTKGLMRNVKLPEVVIDIEGGRTLTIVPKKTWRYLGFFLDPFLSFDEHVKKYSNKAIGAMRAMTMLGNSCGGMSPSMKALVYKSCCLPILTYGLPLWYRIDGKGVLRKTILMKKCQSMAVRWITGGFRTTPIGAMEILSGIPPLIVNMNMLLKRSGIRYRTLHEEHLVKRTIETPFFYTAKKFKRESLQGPPRNPLTNIRQIYQQVDETFAPFHDTNIRGARLMDKFANRIKFEHFNHPAIKSDMFESWFQGFKATIDDWLKNGVVVFTDGSVLKNKGAGFGWAIYDKGVIKEKGSGSFPISSSFDLELRAIEDAIGHATKTYKGEIFVITDIEAASKQIVAPSKNGGQSSIIRTSAILENWFKDHESSRITFSWCPSHKGIEGNEICDKMAKEEAEKKMTIDYTSLSKYREAVRVGGQIQWRKMASMRTYTGSKFLHMKYGSKRIYPSLGAAKKRFINAVDDDTVLFSRLTRTISGHAPIGSYRQTFFPDKNPLCQIHPVIQSRNHVLFRCHKYSRKFDEFTFKNNLESLVSFIKDNIHAFTFEDLGYDPP